MDAHSESDAASDALRDGMLAVLRADGVVTSAEATLTPLTGGVSSEIYLVVDGARTFVVKRALAQLKVRDAWFADVRRNAHERAYLKYVGSFLPEAVPALIHSLSSVPGGGGRGEGVVAGSSQTDCRGRFDIPAPPPSPPGIGERERSYFAMEFLGDGFVNWKAELLAGRVDVEHARRAMDTLATIHSRSFNDASVARTFDTTRDFTQLRVDPYLLTTGSRHPALREQFEQEATRLAACREALVHGDFSPKNMLIGHDGRLVLLDCEVAWYGDPAFDVAFLLNHLLLKALHHAPREVGLRASAEAAWTSYRAVRADDATSDEIERRVVRLLPMLMLARVDGKSPVEYLDVAQGQIVREFVYEVLREQSSDLRALIARWFTRVVSSSTTASTPPLS